MKAPRQFIIVDDDVSNNYLCECAIGVLFPECSVTLFTNPEEALIYLTRDVTLEYDEQSITLFLDIDMPQMDGWSFLKIFQSFNGKVREKIMIYILTSSIDPFDKKQAALNAGVSGFLSKPLIVKELEKLFTEK